MLPGRFLPWDLPINRTGDAHVCKWRFGPSTNSYVFVFLHVSCSVVARDMPNGEPMAAAGKKKATEMAYREDQHGRGEAAAASEETARGPVQCRGAVAAQLAACRETVSATAGRCCTQAKATWQGGQAGRGLQGEKSRVHLQL